MLWRKVRCTFIQNKWLSSQDSSWPHKFADCHKRRFGLFCQVRKNSKLQVSAHRIYQEVSGLLPTFRDKSLEAKKHCCWPLPQEDGFVSSFSYSYCTETLQRNTRRLSWFHQICEDKDSRKRSMWYHQHGSDPNSIFVSFEQDTWKHGWEVLPSACIDIGHQACHSYCHTRC